MSLLFYRFLLFAHNEKEDGFFVSQESDAKFFIQMPKVNFYLALRIAGKSASIFKSALELLIRSRLSVRSCETHFSHFWWPYSLSVNQNQTNHFSILFRVSKAAG
jgi:hypothetical protein